MLLCLVRAGTGRQTAQVPATMILCCVSVGLDLDTGNNC